MKSPFLNSTYLTLALVAGTLAGVPAQQASAQSAFGTPEPEYVYGHRSHSGRQYSPDNDNSSFGTTNSYRYIPGHVVEGHAVDGHAVDGHAIDGHVDAAGKYVPYHYVPYHYVPYHYIPYHYVPGHYSHSR